MSSENKEVTTVKPHEIRPFSPFEEMERMFDDFFQHRMLTPSWMPRLKFPELSGISPSVDMYEEGDDIVIKAEIPGISREDISIDLADDVISISGEKKSEERTERKDFLRLERNFGTFTRKLRLPVEVRSDAARATFKDGVLEVRLPKSEEAKQRVRKIPVG